MAEMVPTIGLEIHAELKTQTKMFCDSKNDADETEPNVNICPVCMAHPGTLPVINKEAVRHVLKIGYAARGEIADFTEFDRKNYFYPDIPKGYQISQYKYPLVKGGSIGGVELTRIHLEEDTARSTHDKGDYSLIDYNRAGVPLMELVTEPVIHSAKEAGDFARELQLLLQYLNIGEANMEKGEMRLEANISIAPEGQMGTKVEVKNLNSFKSVEKAIEFELKRQKEVIEDGGEITQETRGWDEAKQKTVSQREKESSEDYRYFPEPDLPKLFISEVPEFSGEIIKGELPELPWEKRERYKNLGKETENNEYKIDSSCVETLVSNFKLGDLFDVAVSLQPEAYKLLANYICSDISGLVSKYGEEVLENINGPGLSEVVVMYMDGSISSRGVKNILEIMSKDGGDPKKIAEDNGFMQVSDENHVEELAQKIISENPDAVSQYKKGNENSLKFLIGQGMKESKGSVNPQMLTEVLKKLL